MTTEAVLPFDALVVEEPDFSAKPSHCHPTGKTSNNVGYGNLSGGVGDLDVATDGSGWTGDAEAVADPWATRHGMPPSYLSNEEALHRLASRDSGVRPEHSRRAYRAVKRTFDLLASGAAITVLAIPSLILCAILCAKSPGASPLYCQWRIGRVRSDGSFRPFRMWKFRSMVPEADSMLASLQERNEASGPLFKIREDPRVIPGVGEFIRRHSIDELPQLLNVFAGQMSLIGPRPGLPREVALYDVHAMKRLTVKPGCGGLWQVSGRNDVGFDRMVELDLEYIANRSVAQDLGLIFETIRAMLSGKGAA